jgi:DHA2 family multidrug resistance protein-like MFS transporter
MASLFSRQEIHAIGPGLPAHERFGALLAIMLGVCVASLDTAIANTALPTIANELRVSEAASTWVVSGYQLAMVAALLPAAALGDVLGHRRVFLWGLVLFTVSSLGCGLADSLPALVGWRLVQGLGAAGVMGINGALVRVVYPSGMLGRGLGLNALVVGLAFAGGPTAASLVLLLGSWHWLFLINVPICAVAVFYGLRFLPATERHSHGFDGLAALLCAAALALLASTLTEAAHQATVESVIVQAVLGFVLLAWLLKRQSGHPAPILAMDLLRNPVFALSAATAVCSFAAQALAFISLPFLLQSLLGYSQVETGFLITPWPLVVAAMAPLAGRLSDRYEPGLLCGIGLALLALGLLSLALLPPHPTVAGIVWRMALCGAGFGFFQSPNLRAIMGSAPASRSGGASGMVGTVRLLGQSSGAALVAACFHVSSMNGAVYALWLGAACAASAAVFSFLRLRRRALAV